MKPRLLWLLYVLTFGIGLAALPAGPDSARIATGNPDADLAWRQLVGVWQREPRMKAKSYDRVADLMDWERRALNFREGGLRFWERFPSDMRRWEWLRRTVMNQPRYWSNPQQGAEAFATGKQHLAVRDAAKLAAWKEKYAILRQAFAIAPEVTNEMRWLLTNDELRGEIRELNYAARRGESLDAVDLAKQTVDFVSTAPDSYNRQKAGLARNMLLYLEHDRQAELIVVDGLKDNSDPELQWLANGREQIMRMRGKPADLQILTMDGQVVELAQMRGKIVLLSFWATTCSGCIKSMPRLKTIYDQYQSDGFEIVSLVFNDEKDRPVVERLLREMQIPWPQSLQGRLKNGHSLADRFAIKGVPVYFLLDQNGLLVTNDIKGDRLEREVRRLLGLSPLDVPSATEVPSELGL